MRLRTLVAAITAVGLAPQAQASSAIAGKIGSVLPIGNGPVLFNHDGTRSTRPSCATSPERWAIDASTPGGQAKLAVLLTAYAQNKPIIIIGSGTCDIWTDTETVYYLHTDD